MALHRWEFGDTVEDFDLNGNFDELNVADKERLRVAGDWDQYFDFEANDFTYYNNAYWHALAFSNGVQPGTNGAIWRKLGSGDMTKAVYDTTGNSIVDNAEKLGGQSPAQVRDRSTQTGTQTASTISDFQSAARDSMEYATGAPVQTLADLRSVGPTRRQDKQQRLVEDAGVNYRFDAEGTGTDNGDGIIAPNSGTGRWFKSSAAASSTGNADTLNGQNGAYYRERANHTGTQLASTISDFAETTQDTLASTIVAGTGITKTYDDAAGTLTLSATSSGAGASSVAVTQNAHGLIVGDFIKVSGTTYSKAQGDTALNAEVVGRVDTVPSPNTFTYQPPGSLVTGLSGLTAGTSYFLSTSTAGTSTAIDPFVFANAAKIRKVVMVATSATTALLVYDPGAIITFGGQLVQGYDPTYGDDIGYFRIHQLVTVAAAATTTTTISIPAGALVESVALRVVTAIPTASTFSLGVSGAATRYANAKSVAAGTTNVSAGTTNPSVYATATNLLITPNATPASATGQIRVVVWYKLATAPTS